MSLRYIHLPMLLCLAAGCTRDSSPSHSNTGSRDQIHSQKASQTLLEARSGFRTTVVPGGYEPDGTAADPPPDLLQLVTYTSPVGELAAYVSPDPMDGERYPALIWAHGGFGGIGSWLWEPAPATNDQSVRQYIESGIVVLCPSWRGENDNPGEFEMFFGEVDDLLAARDYIDSLSYVDSDRVYLAGHSSGGTLALLAATTGTDRFRAVFSFGGNPDLEATYADGVGYEHTPFDYRGPRECELRSAINFVSGIQVPTYYFEGVESPYCTRASEMQSRARRDGVSFTACIIDGGNHFNILAPLHRMVAERILADTADHVSIEISPDDADDACRAALQDYAEARAAAVAQFPVFEVTAEAVHRLLAAMREESLDFNRTFVRVGISDGQYQLGFDDRFDESSDVRVVESEVIIVSDRRSLEMLRGYLLHYDSERKGFAFIDPYSRARGAR